LRHGEAGLGNKAIFQTSLKDRRSGQQRAETLSSSWRVGGRILLATPYTVILLPLQIVVLALDLRFGRPIHC